MSSFCNSNRRFICSNILGEDAKQYAELEANPEFNGFSIELAAQFEESILQRDVQNKIQISKKSLRE